MLSTKANRRFRRKGTSQRGALFFATDAGKSLNIKLRPEALVALTGDGVVVSREDIKEPAPRRRANRAKNRRANISFE